MAGLEALQARPSPVPEMSARLPRASQCLHGTVQRTGFHGGGFHPNAAGGFGTTRRGASPRRLLAVANDRKTDRRLKAAQLAIVTSIGYLAGKVCDIKVEIRRNQHALRAVSRRTPTPMLLPLLRTCSFRLVNDASACASVGAWLGRSATSSGPRSPFLRNRSVSRRQLATEATLGDRRPGRRIESTHPLQRMASQQSHPRQMKSGGS